jgi:hypothetical protein
MIWPDMVAACRSPETFPDLFPVYQTANYGDPDNIAFAAYHSSRNGNWQNAVYKNPEVDRADRAGPVGDGRGQAHRHLRRCRRRWWPTRRTSSACWSGASWRCATT